MPNNRSSDDERPFPQHPANQFSRPVGMMHKFYLSGDIGDPNQYVEWFETIRSAGEDDYIFIHINSGGGRADTAIQFMRVLMETRAMTIASVEGYCMSAATFIFLAAKQHQITDHSIFLCHNYSSGALGKGGELHTRIMHERKWSETLVRSVYKDFLTESELNELLDDKDFWLTPEEVVTRLMNRHAKFAESQEMAMKKNQAAENLLKAIQDTPPVKVRATKKKAVKKAKKAKSEPTPELLTE